MSDEPPNGPRPVAALGNPASIAFAQTAEEHRRAGHFAEAVRVCRIGLAHHPGYLSARVTLGRSLLALGDLEDAAAQLLGVLRAAPDHLAALMALAEIHERRGAPELALGSCRIALSLVPRDRDLSERVAALEARVARDVHGGGLDSGDWSEPTRNERTIRRLERWLEIIAAERARRDARGAP